MGLPPGGVSPPPTSQSPWGQWHPLQLPQPALGDAHIFQCLDFIHFINEAGEKARAWGWGEGYSRPASREGVMGNQANSPRAPVLEGAAGVQSGPCPLPGAQMGLSHPRSPAGARQCKIARAAPGGQSPGGGRRQGAGEPPQEGGRGSGLPESALVQRARVQQAAGPSSRRWGPGVPSCVGKKTGA